MQPSASTHCGAASEISAGLTQCRAQQHQQLHRCTTHVHVTQLPLDIHKAVQSAGRFCQHTSSDAAELSIQGRTSPTPTPKTHTSPNPRAAYAVPLAVQQHTGPPGQHDTRATLHVLSQLHKTAILWEPGPWLAAASQEASVGSSRAAHCFTLGSNMESSGMACRR